MSKTYDLSNLRILGLHDDDDKHTISYDSSKFTPKHRFWDIVTRYIIYWKRGECDSHFLQRIFNPDKLPEHVVAKWVVNLCKNEGAYKAELFDTMCKRRVKDLKKSKKLR